MVHNQFRASQYFLLDLISVASSVALESTVVNQEITGTHYKLFDNMDIN